MEENNLMTSNDSYQYIDYSDQRDACDPYPYPRM